MSSGFEKFMMRVASDPAKSVAAAAAIVEAAPVLIPVAVVGAAGYGIYKMISKMKKG